MIIKNISAPKKCIIIWRPPSLSELTQMIFNKGLTHLGSEASIYHFYSIIWINLKLLSYRGNGFICYIIVCANYMDIYLNNSDVLNFPYINIEFSTFVILIITSFFHQFANELYGTRFIY